MAEKSPRIVVVMGTRPEAVKLAPVVRALRDRAGAVPPIVVSTGQHREMLEQVLTPLGVTPDIDLALMEPVQELSELTARVLRAMTTTLANLKPDLVVVQGDTTTAFTTALAAFYQRIAVGHVEAGLRSHDLEHPYPEEMNRRLASALATIHFAPTASARENLLAEGIAPSAVCVTGNTVVDSLMRLQEIAPGLTESPVSAQLLHGRRLLLVTSHRRETWGAQLEGICWALRTLVATFDDLLVVYPVHLNPNVAGPVHHILGGEERIVLLPPLGYVPFVNLMRQAHFIITDSGGVQEEAPTLGKPVLVIRHVTERPEASRLGLGRVIGTDPEELVRAASELLTDPAAYKRMSRQANPYGDGRAAGRIADAIARWWKGDHPLLPLEREFAPVGGQRPVSGVA